MISAKTWVYQGPSLRPRPRSRPIGSSPTLHLSAPREPREEGMMPGELPGMSKIIVTGNEQRREYELGAINTVGRHPDNTLQILDRIVSKEHAQIIRQPDGRFLFRDLGS